MRRELLAVCIILVIILITNRVCQKYLNTAADKVCNELQNLVKLSTNILDSQDKQDTDNDNTNNFQKLQDKITLISDEWDKYEKVLSLFIEHRELEKIDTSIVRIRSYIDINELDEAIPEMNECIFVINHIQMKQKMSFANLF